MGGAWDEKEGAGHPSRDRSQGCDSGHSQGNHYLRFSLPGGILPPSDSLVGIFH